MVINNSKQYFSTIYLITIYWYNTILEKVAFAL